MLGGVTKGPVLPTFQLLKEAGFEGVELISPNQLDQAEVLAARDKTGLVIHGVSGGRHWQEPLSDPDPKVVERGMAAIRQEFLDCKAYGGTTVLVVPAVVNKKVSYRDAYTRSQENIRKLIPHAEAGWSQDRHRGGLEQVPPQPRRVRPLHRRVRQPLRRSLLRRRQRRRVRLPRGMDPRAGQAHSQDPHQGIRQAQAIRLQAGRGRDRLAGRPPGACGRRLPGLDHRRSGLWRPGRDEGRGAPDELAVPARVTSSSGPGPGTSENLAFGQHPADHKEASDRAGRLTGGSGCRCPSKRLMRPCLIAS